MARTIQSLTRAALARADAAMNRLYGWKHNPIYHSGAIAVAMLLVLIATGTYLILFYRIGAPYASMERITEQVWLGGWVRTLHRYSADLALVAVAVHAVRMFAQRKSWGPRVLAWVSGLLLLFVFFICGWTGYVLVWDNQAQLLAVSGARLLDVLPLFSEPIGRTFVGEGPMPSAFFFINFFLHVALPLGVGLMLWVHVARVARPLLLPPKALGWGIVGVLGALSLLWPVRMAPEADLLRVPSDVPLDVFYGFWVPFAEIVSPGVVWAAFLAVALGLLLVPRFTRPPAASRPAPSVVDERSCTGCEQCYHDCPYEAISMVERSDGRMGLVAQVDPGLCVSCGICAGSCAPMVVGPPGRSGRDQLAGVRARIDAGVLAAGEVVLVACERGAGAAARAAAEAGVVLHPVACVGSMHTSVVEQYLRSGARGVMIAACPPRDCWNREGAKWAEQRLFHGREAELKERVDRARVHLARVDEAEPALLARELAAFRARLALLDPVEGETDVDLLALCERAEEAAR
jgi:coenzyme F420-reducing hydrogenase delta subunit/Pyruvate/2-oxoacid:ferredoxin oxidoreductase delta subunit